MNIHCRDKVYIRFGVVGGEGYLWFVPCFYDLCVKLTLRSNKHQHALWRRSLFKLVCRFSFHIETKIPKSLFQYETD